MSTHQLHEEDEAIYFITFTCHDWLPLFSLTNAYDTVYQWFEIIKSKGARTLGYVIMPNHVHCILFIKKGGEHLNKLVSNGKRFMAYEIIRRLKSSAEEEVLSKLSAAVTRKEKLAGKIHKVFIPSFDAKLCYNERMIITKLNYMHGNPVSGKWQLSTDYLSYEHSSARFYESGELNEKCKLFHYQELE